MNNFFAVYHTDVGIRKKTNQDSLLIKGIAKETEEVLLALICDGMGGMAKGELASATVIRAFVEWFEKVYPTKGSGWTREEIRSQWQGIFEEVNEKLIAYGKDRGIQLGTTATVILILPEKEYLIGHIGDTRVYQIGEGLYQLTEDHTFVAREIRRGNMTPEQAAQDSRRNVLLQCIGVNLYMEPQFLEGQFKAGECVMLCSDGFRHKLTGGEIFECLRPEQFWDEAKMRRALIELTERNKQRQETDNISSILIKLR